MPPLMYRLRAAWAVLRNPYRLPPAGIHVDLSKLYGSTATASGPAGVIGSATMDDFDKSLSIPWQKVGDVTMLVVETPEGARTEFPFSPPIPGIPGDMMSPRLKLTVTNWGDAK